MGVRTMTRQWKTWTAGLVAGLMLSPALRAQPPAIPAAPAAPAAAAALPAPAAPQNLWSFLCLSPEQKAACKAKFCNSALGKLVSSMTGPLQLYSGGLIGNFCPTTPTKEDLAQPADSAGGAAARIKQQEAAAKKRREDVRYLGTVDCRRFPEAEAALIGSLRGDTNECVRYEAALALRRGCCCTKPVVEALKATVSGSAKDYPAETSPRVLEAAREALERCQASGQPAPEPVPPEKPQPPEAPARPDQTAIQLTNYVPRIEPVPSVPAALTVAPASGHSLAEIWSRTESPRVPQLAGAVEAQPVKAAPVRPARSRDLFTVLRSTLGGS